MAKHKKTEPLERIIRKKLSSFQSSVGKSPTFYFKHNKLIVQSVTCNVSKEIVTGQMYR